MSLPSPPKVARLSLHAIDAITGRTPLHYAAESLNAPLCAVDRRRCLAPDCRSRWRHTSDARAHRDDSFDPDEGMGAGYLRAKVTQELRWLPGVRMLWLAHKADALAHQRRDEGGVLPVTTVRELTKDLIRLIVDEMIGCTGHQRMLTLDLHLIMRRREARVRPPPRLTHTITMATSRRCGAWFTSR